MRSVCSPYFLLLPACGGYKLASSSDFCDILTNRKFSPDCSEHDGGRLDVIRRLGIVHDRANGNRAQFLAGSAQNRLDSGSGLRRGKISSRWDIIKQVFNSNAGTLFARHILLLLDFGRLNNEQGTQLFRSHSGFHFQL